MHAATDKTGKTADQRFLEIRAYFLEHMALSGQSRTTLYFKPPAGAPPGYMTETAIVRHWAEQMVVSVNDICIGIQRAFDQARNDAKFVTSFRYVQPHIVRRWNELREARVGAGPEFHWGSER